MKAGDDAYNSMISANAAFMLHLTRSHNGIREATKKLSDEEYLINKRVAEFEAKKRRLADREADLERKQREFSREKADFMTMLEAANAGFAREVRELHVALENFARII